MAPSEVPRRSAVMELIKITLFQNNVVFAARDEETIQKLIKKDSEFYQTDMDDYVVETISLYDSVEELHK